LTYNRTAVIKKLKTELIPRLQKAITSNKSSKQYDIGIEIFYKGQALSRGNVKAHYTINRGPNTSLSVHNTSTLTYTSGQIMIAVLVSEDYYLGGSNVSNLVSLPNDKIMYILDTIDTLFPGAFLPINLVIGRNDEDFTKSIDIIIKVFTEAGSREYPLTFVYESNDHS
jgi:hypothetical protein